jgi:hypothetical protein
MKPQTEIKKGCGKEACGVPTRDTETGEEDCDIIMCGDYCPYHNKVEYCPTCQAVPKDRKEVIEMIKNVLQTQADFITNDEFGKGYRKAIEHIRENILAKLQGEKNE